MDDWPVTRPCTPVYYRLPDWNQKVRFAVRECQKEPQYTWKKFKSNRLMDVDSISDLLDQKKTNLVEEQRKFVPKKEEKEKKKPKPVKMTWEELMNWKRLRIAQCLKQQHQRNLAEVSRMTGTSFGLIKKVLADLEFNGEITPFRYQNVKAPEDLEMLDHSISHVNGTYTTLSDLKRCHPQFSRRYIAKRVRATGLRWLLMRKDRRKKKDPGYTDKDVISTVSHLAQSMDDKAVETFYLDEVHFPLEQTSDRHWTMADFRGHNLHYNRRLACGKKLSAIAMCSEERFVAVQIFQKDITGQDFQYFLVEAMNKVPRKSRVTVLADNAKWHKTKAVMKTKAFKAIHFNTKRLFQANLIENCFSFVRSDFRKRPLVESLEEEAGLLLRIFFNEDNERRFQGVARNHVRSLKKLLLDHYMAIQSRRKRFQERENQDG